MNKLIEIRVVNVEATEYNAWVDATLEPKKLQKEIDAKIKGDGGDVPVEYKIVDTKGFGDCFIYPWECLSIVYELACFIQEFPDFGGELLYKHNNYVADARCEAEKYIGSYVDVNEFLMEYLVDSGATIESIKSYIDFKRLARDEVKSKVFSMLEGREGKKTHIFTV